MGAGPVASVIPHGGGAAQRRLDWAIRRAQAHHLASRRAGYAKSKLDGGQQPQKIPPAHQTALLNRDADLAR